MLRRGEIQRIDEKLCSFVKNHTTKPLFYQNNAYCLNQKDLRVFYSSMNEKFFEWKLKNQEDNSNLQNLNPSVDRRKQILISQNTTNSSSSSKQCRSMSSKSGQTAPTQMIQKPLIKYKSGRLNSEELKRFLQGKESSKGQSGTKQELEKISDTGFYIRRIKSRQVTRYIRSTLQDDAFGGQSHSNKNQCLKKHRLSQPPHKRETIRFLKQQFKIKLRKESTASKKFY